MRLVRQLLAVQVIQYAGRRRYVQRMLAWLLVLPRLLWLLVALPTALAQLPLCQPTAMLIA